MKTYRKHFQDCQRVYQGYEDQRLYRVLLEPDFIERTEEYDRLISSISKQIDHKFKNEIDTRREDMCLRLEKWDDIEDLDKLAKMIVSKLEREVFGSHVKIEFLHVYRNLQNDAPAKSSWLWHYDDCPDEFLKLAVYLNDVTVDNAPMWCFLDKDQTPIKVRSSRISPNQSTSKVFEASRIPEWFLKEEKGRGSNYACLVGPAGKNFLFTPNIIHKASKPVKGHRDAMFLFLRPTSVKLDDPLNSAEPRANVRDVKKYRLD